MASRLNISIVLVLMLCITCADAWKCKKNYATCYPHKDCKTNLQSDCSNCGSCGHSCPKHVSHAYPLCKKGHCTYNCYKSFGDCDRNATNGCETPLTTLDNCGACGKNCTATGNNTVAACVSGHCKTQCITGYSKCHKNCVDLKNDKFNCGKCGKVCPNQAATNVSFELEGFCYQGQCKLTAGCFPGDATVRLEYDVKKMSELELGDKVAVLKPDGSIAYESVYLFGHKDAAATSSFYRLSLKSGAETRTLELTAKHFVPISATTGKTYKRAEDVVKGDKMWVAGESPGALFVVAEISEVTKQGLYNPYTLGGNIVVNGVVASAHSDWFLDDLFQSLNLVHLLPAVYQAVLTPVRMLYNGMGKDLYIATYNMLDSQVNIAEAGTKYAGSFFTTVGVASAAAALLLSNRSKKV